MVIPYRMEVVYRPDPLDTDNDPGMLQLANSFLPRIPDQRARTKRPPNFAYWKEINGFASTARVCENHLKVAKRIF